MLGAFALGYFFRSRLAAMTTYSVAYLWTFTFQTLYLQLDSLGGGSNPAFETQGFPLSYGLVTMAIFAGGLGLVEAGHRLGTRRGSARSVTSDQPAVLA